MNIVFSKFIHAVAYNSSNCFFIDEDTALYGYVMLYLPICQLISILDYFHFYLL